MTQAPYQNRVDNTDSHQNTSEEKTIVRYGKVFALANIINRAAGLLLIPLYTHTLGLEEYGVYALVVSTSDLLSILFGIGFTGAFSRFYFNDSDAAYRKQLVSTVFIGYAAIALLILACAYPIAKTAVHILFQNDAHLPVFFCAIAGLIFTLLFEITVGYAVIRKKPWQCFFMASSKAILLLLLNGILVFWLDWGLLGIVLSTAIALGSISVSVMVAVLLKNGLSFSFNLLIELFRFGVALMPSAFANTAQSVIERYLLNALISPAAVGAYALAHRLSSTISMFIAAPFSQIFFVRRFESLLAGEKQQAFNKILLNFVAIVSCAAFGLSLFSNEIIIFLAPSDYQYASLLVPWLSICFVLSALNQNLELGILYKNKPWRVAKIGLTVLLISAPFYFFLIKPFGAIGAALGLLCTYVVRIFLTVRTNKKLGVTFMQIDWVRAISILSFTLLLSCLLSNLFSQSFSFIQILTKVVIFLCFLGLFVVTPILDKQSRKQIVGLLKSLSPATFKYFLKNRKHTV